MATQKDMEKAQAILDKLVADERFMWSGRRNDDAVDVCICCRVLNLDPVDWFNALYRKDPDRFSSEQRMKALKHIARIEPYAESWGPTGNEGAAFEKSMRPENR